MSTTTWLAGQKKQYLLDLADKVGLEDLSSGMLKADLAVALDSHMRSNSSKFAQDPALSAFFDRITSASPTKDPSSAGALVPAKTPRRRTTVHKPKEPELESSVEPAGSGTIVKSPNERAQSIPLPPSPSAVADSIDRQTTKMRDSISQAYERSGITEQVDAIRDVLSTPASIESIGILVELFGVHTTILPYKFLTQIPPIRYLNNPVIPIKVPDLFVMLNSEFWALSSLWFLTSVILPMFFAYFFNLTLKAKHKHVRHAKNVHPAAQYDPLSFNVAKALITWLVYSKNLQIFGFPNIEAVAKIQGALPAGTQSVYIAAAIGVLVSIYQAILKV